MKDYKINGKVIDITLDNGQVVKCSTEWAEKSMKARETNMEDVLLMFLGDNGKVINEEQEELNRNAKGKVKLIAKNEKPRQKTQKERVIKENPTKELIIQTIAKSLENLDISNLNIENKGKIITFTMNNEDYKIDLVQKRKKKAETP